jgi:predicted nucleic acid-binding protein
MELVSYFLDTYALIEILKENKNYAKFKDTLNFTGLMNLLELHYIIIRKFGAQRADKTIESLKQMLISMTLRDVKDASRFRKEYVKRKFSYIDCLSYVASLNRKLKFVTGDKQFESLPDVEFVK